MIKGKHLILVLVINLLLLIGIVYWFNKNTPKVAYVKIQEVYSEFGLTKELEKKMVSVTSARKNILDSLELKLKSMNLAFKTIKDLKVLEEKKQEFQLQSQEYMLKKKNFMEDNQRVSTDYESQILKQLNEYIFNYGKEQGVDFIYGANGNGSIMYGSDKFDVTEDVIKYVNKRYSGEEK